MKAEKFFIKMENVHGSGRKSLVIDFLSTSIFDVLILFVIGSDHCLSS